MSKITVFMEYKVKNECVQEYEKLMKEFARALSTYDANHFQWFQAADQEGLYVEMFDVPTLSHYHTLKKWRRSKEHSLFKKLDEHVVGGLEKVNCWAFLRKDVK